MESLVKGLLEYAKARHEPIRTERVDCRQLLNDSLSDLQVAIRESGAEIKCGSLPEVSADSIQLRRVFENLIQNAIKFRGDKPLEINIRAIDRGSHWQFEFADNGKGIAAAYQQRVFDLFARGPGGQQEGTGMGLAACKAVIERHGGHIGVISRENGGSVFYFSLPKCFTMKPLLSQSFI